MRKNINKKILRVSAIVLMVIIAVTFIPANTEAAEIPEWEEGDSWAMGYEDDMDELFTSIIKEFEQDIEEDDELEEITQIEDIDFDLDGEIGFYQIFEVSDVHEDGYIVEMNIGGGAYVEGSLTITAEMPVEGTYTEEDFEDPDEIPMETKELSLNGGVYHTLDIDGTIEYNEDIAIEQISLDMNNEISATVEVQNVPFSEEFMIGMLPMFADDFDTEPIEPPEDSIELLEREEEPPIEDIVIDYTDYDFSVTADMTTSLDIEFDPALDIFDFPIEVDEEWDAESEISITGTYEGIIDVEGLPPALEELLEEALKEEGLSLPLILEELETEEEEGFYEGKIDLPPEGEDAHFSIPIMCRGTDTIELHDGETTEVYQIEFRPEYDGGDDFYLTKNNPEPHFIMLYSEDEGFIVELDIYLGEESEEFGISDMSMRSMDPEEAREKMGDMQEIDEDEDEDDEGIPGFTAVLMGLSFSIAIFIYYQKEKKNDER